MKTEEIIKNDDSAISEIVQKKRAAWANMGQTIHEAESLLQIQAQDAILKAKLPTKIADIAGAETDLKELKARQATIIVNRKKITGTLDDVTKRLMAPEKSLDDPISTLANAIITLKKEHERIEQIKVLKQDEIRSIKEKIASILANKDYDFKSDISMKVTVAYEHALTHDIKPEDASEFINKCVAKVGVMHFQVDKPSFTLKYVLPEEMEHILEETFLCNPHAYLTMLHTEMEKKFSDYTVAYANKKDALELAKKDEETKQAALKTELENKELANSIEAGSTPVTTGPDIKALKKVYEVDMAENYDNAKRIMAAFYANEIKAAPKLQVKNWYSFTPKQAAAALSKLKCDDNNFQPAGIIFKEVDKL